MPKSVKYNKKQERIKVIDLKKVNEVKQKKKKNTIKTFNNKKVWVKKRKTSTLKESSGEVKNKTFKVFKHPVYKTKKEFLQKLETKLNDYFDCIPEDLKTVKISNVLEELTLNKTITVSIGDCSYIFEGGDFKDKDKIKNIKVKNILSTMAKNLRNL